ncbi:hypothetical protein EB796_006267 [Bugula neritina]|uniref:Uncharacterized protein n=1 Tax=Bugula neritina TaxID=10212 RepID=A0A7J7KB48_BUGNE|nr:hypothetical protein EB796_006267 [Bugula neritina]
MVSVLTDSKIEVNPYRSGLAATQEETEAVSTHPETPSVMIPIRPVLPPSSRIEDYRTILDIDNLLVLKSNVCCKYKKRQ